MARQARFRPSAVLAFSAMVAALGTWSCNGALESPTATSDPTAVAGSDEAGGVAESKAAPKVTICHKGKDLSVAASALPGHLGHGDRLGGCTPAPTSCPCFTAEALAAVAASCSVGPIASCPVQYSIQLFCAPGGSGGGAVGNLGLFEAELGTDTCSTTSNDPITGDEVISTIDITPAQYEACRQAIVTTPVYPASCPR